MDFKKGFSLILVLPVVAIFLVAGIVGFSYLQNIQIKQPVVENSQKFPEPIGQKPTVDPTSNWKVYTSENPSYSFKYPIDWVVNRDGIYLNIKTLDQISAPIGPIVVTAQKTNKSLEQFFAEDNPSTGGKVSDTYKFDRSQVVDGETGKVTYGGCCGFFGEFVFVKHGDYIYQIVLTGPFEKSVVRENQEIFDKILSTFKFL